MKTEELPAIQAATCIIRATNRHKGRTRAVHPKSAAVRHLHYGRVRRDSSLHFAAGGPSCERDLNIVIGKNVQAGRLLAGVTFSKPGNWTSWPPHEHAALLEEAYLYIAMPTPAWGVQLVYTNAAEP